MLLGADVMGLLKCVNEIAQHRRKVSAAAARMERVVSDAQWVGPDRERFLANWSNTYRPAVLTAVNELDEDGAKLRRHVECQRQTSDG